MKLIERIKKDYDNHQERLLKRSENVTDLTEPQKRKLGAIFYGVGKILYLTPAAIATYACAKGELLNNPQWALVAWATTFYSVDRLIRIYQKNKEKVSENLAYKFLSIGSESLKNELKNIENK